MPLALHPRFISGLAALRNLGNKQSRLQRHNMEGQRVRAHILFEGLEDLVPVGAIP